jgi:hypothetical protein
MTPAEREALFTRMVSAFARKDYEALKQAYRPDVVLKMAGSSRFAGTYQGLEEVGNFLLDMGHVLRSAERPIGYDHLGHELIAHHTLLLQGPNDLVEVVLHIRIVFDSDDRASSIFVEPEDLRSFDAVLDPTPRGD